MAVKNSETSYGSVAKFFHWGMFLLISGLVVVGFYMHGLPADTPEQAGYKYDLYDQHKAFGIVALILVTIRLGWRLKNPVPKMPDGMRKIELLSAHAMHILLYFLMFAQPLSGWLRSSYGGHDTEIFGMALPMLVAKDKGLEDFFHETHEMLASVLIAAFLLHVGAALYHHFVRKDDVLLRMSPHGKSAE